MFMKLKNVAISIIGINVVMFILQIMFAKQGFTEALYLSYADVFRHPWTIFTSMFLHSPQNVTHIVFNMYSLFIFGPLIEQRVGSKRFLIIYLASGLIAGMGTVAFHLFGLDVSNSPGVLGASGAIMGVIGLTIMLLPHLRVLLFFFIPMSLRTAAIIFALIDIFGLFSDNGVANIAHLIGLAVGLTAGYLIKRKELRRVIIRRAPKRRKKVTNEPIELDEHSFDEYLRSGRI